MLLLGLWLSPNVESRIARLSQVSLIEHLEYWIIFIVSIKLSKQQDGLYSVTLSPISRNR